MDRSCIANAPYNARTIGYDARQRLENNLKEDGLVATITWNKRTGRMVGGHQRLAILDDLHEGKPYSLPVDMIDVDEAHEMRINVRLNSPDGQGEFDVQRLNDQATAMRAADPTMNLPDALGLSEARLEVMGIDPTLWLPKEDDEVREVVEDAAKILDLKKVRKEHKAQKREEDLKAELRNLIVQFPMDLSLKEMGDRRKALLAAVGVDDELKPVVPAYKFEAALGLGITDESDDDEGDDDGPEEKA